uniref:Kunitz/Bovine pancreatic trypsin inhibitor domain protein n=1 Tax=Haemonchus contortus TaxID=6289 RepID=A0A7I4YZN5_HAECO
MPSPLCVFLLLNGAAVADFLVKPRVAASVNYDDYSLLCAEGVPLLMEDHRPRPCQPRPWLPEHKCPASFWCHEGDDESSYYCCPKNRKFENRCHLPPATGHGTLSMRRFYYDWMSDGCHELHYTGIGGNENSFMTYENCEEACRGAGEPSVNPPEGSKISKDRKLTKKPPITSSTTTTTISTTPLPSSASVDTRSNEKGQEVVKSSGSEEKTEVKPSLSTTSQASPSTATVRKVTEFVTSPSPDSSESRSEDEHLRTLWQDTNPCEAPASAGSSGGIARKMWYFDESAISCVPFVFLGSGGNANRFADQGTCMRTCGSGKPTRASCELPSQFGNGTFKIPRYYFDKTAKQCELFYYSGNGGNENRFLKKTKCERLCLGKKNKKQSTMAVVTSTIGTRPVTRMFQEFHSTEATTTSPTTTAASTPTQSETSTERQSNTFTFVSSTPRHNSPNSSSKEETNLNYTSSSEESSTLDPFPTLINIPKEFIPPFPQVTLLPAAPSGGEEIPETTPAPAQTGEYNFIFEHIKTSSETPQVIAPFPTAQLVSAENVPDLNASPKWSGEGSAEATLPLSTQPPAVNLPVLPKLSNQGEAEKFPGLIVSPKWNGPKTIEVILPSPIRPAAGQPLPSNWNAQKTAEIVAPAPSVLPATVPPVLIAGPMQAITLGPTTEVQPSSEYLGQQRPAFPLKGAVSQVVQPSLPPMFYISNPGLHPAPGAPIAYQYAKNSAVTVDGIAPQYGSQFSSHQKPGGVPDPQWVERGMQAFHQVLEKNMATTAAPVQPPSAPPISNHIMPQDLAAGLQELLQRQTNDKSQFSAIVKGEQPGRPSAPRGTTNHEVTSNHSQVALDVSPCQSPLHGDVVIMCVLEGVTCPAGTFCQVGDAQSICCPTLPEPQCEQPQRPGVGSSTLLRWYYKPSTRQCHMFVFHGFQGNQNNFESLQECESTCRDLNPCEEGTPLPAIDGSQNCFPSLPLSCPEGSYCKAHGNRGVCCTEPIKSIRHPISDSIRPECLMPEDAGHGVESSHRWSYDSSTRKCVSFIYHGYGGNQNNFLSRNDCETACIPTNPCDQPVSSGHGNRFISRFFFSKEYGQCLHFAYSGEGGNSNNFANLRECVDTCMSNSSYFRSLPAVAEVSIPIVIQKICPHGDVAMIGQIPMKCDVATGYGCPSGYICKPAGADAYCCQAPESFCLQPRPPLNVCLSPNSPPVQRIQFTYDPLADRCVRFSYSSCSPDYNLNHFETDSQCQRLCCNQGYDLVYKRRLLMLNDSPLDDFEDTDRH